MHPGLAFVDGKVRLLRHFTSIRSDLNRRINLLNHLINNHVFTFVYPNALKQGARSEKQQRGVTMITVITAEQNIVGDGVPATAVIKMSNQLWIKYYSIKMKQNQPKPGTKMHRGALATANRARRRSCRPRRRKTWTASFRWR